MQELLRINRAVMRLVVLGFVKVTCSRSGVFARDWADRAEKQVSAWHRTRRCASMRSAVRIDAKRGAHREARRR